MRYSAATCEPDDFHSKKYSLRQVHYDPPRRTELFIVMTMSDEDDECLTRTLCRVMKNIAHLCKRNESKTWGNQSWKKVVVCIVSDGRAKVNPRILAVLAAMGVYQEDIAMTRIGSNSVTAHIYEYTTQIAITPSLRIKGIVPVQIIFCLKEKSSNKINSHQWFFNAFCPILQPNICVLLDVGTVPGPTSIYHLWKAFDIDSRVGGACGEITVDKGQYCTNLFNPLVAAQNFEHKMSSILGKALESLFGYITIVPSAFSAYRYIALQNDRTGEGPLSKYFAKKTSRSSGEMFAAIAEDHILAWELVSKRRSFWLLHYVKSAYATKEVPSRVTDLIIGQRWLNAFFAAIYSTSHFYYIHRSNHSFFRKFWIYVGLLYQFCGLIVSWFTLGNYYISFSIVTTSLENPTISFPHIHIVNKVANLSYMCLVIMGFIRVLGDPPRTSKWGYTFIMIGFAAITLYTTVAALLLTITGIGQLLKEHNGVLQLEDFWTDQILRNYVLSLTTTYGLYLFPSFIFFEPWHMITSFLQYLLMVPSYIHVLHVYAFASIHEMFREIEDDIPSLGVVRLGISGQIEVALPDVDAAYDQALHNLNHKSKDNLMEHKSKGKQEVDVGEQDADPGEQDADPGEQEADPGEQEADAGEQEADAHEQEADARKKEADTRKKEADTRKKEADTREQEAECYRNFRTIVLLFWIFTNSLLASAMTSGTFNLNAVTPGTNTVPIYMTFLLYSMLLLSLVKFCGSLEYMISWGMK